MKFAVAGIIVIILAVGGYVYTIQSRSQTATEALPAVELTDKDGNTFTIQDFQNGEQALVINSWATWCPFCVEELPDLARLQEEFDEDVRVIAINRKESVDRAEGYLADLDAGGVTYLYDSKDAWYRGIGAFTMPETLFVSKEGEIVVHKRGFMALPEMREHVQTTLENI